MITQDELRTMFDYQDGNLLWKIKPSVNRSVGDIAGSVNPDGYLQTSIKGKKYRNHRLVFLWHHGFLPEQVDHIDGNGLNNRIENLRAATVPQNQHNSRLSRRNSTGVKGVSFHKCTGKYIANIRLNGSSKYLGLFTTIEDAASAISAIRNELHGEYANHG